MKDDALADIQSKIAELEDKISRLKIAECEVSKLSGRAASRATPAPAKRSRTAAVKEMATDAPYQSAAERVRAFLKENGPSSAKTISEATGIEGRAVSFTLQALKRSGKAKIVKGEWSTARRRLPKPETESAQSEESAAA